MNDGKRCCWCRGCCAVACEWRSCRVPRSRCGSLIASSETFESHEKGAGMSQPHHHLILVIHHHGQRLQGCHSSYIVSRMPPTSRRSSPGLLVPASCLWCFSAKMCSKGSQVSSRHERSQGHRLVCHHRRQYFVVNTYHPPCETSPHPHPHPRLSRHPVPMRPLLVMVVVEPSAFPVMFHHHAMCSSARLLIVWVKRVMRIVPSPMGLQYSTRYTSCWCCAIDVLFSPSCSKCIYDPMKVVDMWNMYVLD